MQDLPAPGWYPCPYDASQARWWDGTQWTQSVQPLAAPADHPQPPLPAETSTPTQPAGQVDWSTPLYPTHKRSLIRQPWKMGVAALVGGAISMVLQFVFLLMMFLIIALAFYMMLEGGQMGGFAVTLSKWFKPFTQHAADYKPVFSPVFELLSKHGFLLNSMEGKQSPYAAAAVYAVVSLLVTGACVAAIRFVFQRLYAWRPPVWLILGGTLASIAVAGKMADWFLGGFNTMLLAALLLTLLLTAFAPKNFGAEVSLGRL